MRRKRFYILDVAGILSIGLLIAVGLVITGCPQFSVWTAPESEETKTTTDKRAIVIVVENNNMLSENLEYIFEQKRGLIEPILGELFQTDTKNFRGKTLVEIIDEYGEPYIINGLEEVAKGHYERIVTLQDERANFRSFKQLLVDL